MALESVVLRIAVALVMVGLPVWGWAFSVTFISPGHHDEAFWVDASRGMQSAARSLGIHLEIVYAERDVLQQIELTREVTARPPAARPDYLILSVEKGSFAAQMTLAEAAGIPVFLAYNGLLPTEHQQYGLPREHFSELLGSLTPEAEDAGYLTAKKLIDAARHKGLSAPDGRFHLLALSGDRSTDSSIQRNEGMRKAVEEAGDVVVDQLVQTDWRQDVAAFKAGQLYQRYPDATLVWSGSDQVAFGAMSALGRRIPGKDVLFSGVNTSAEAMQAVISGKLTALAGGHFMAGAWALVVLYDYQHGIDFADSEGLEMARPMFTLFSPAKARRYLAIFGASGVPSLDFRPFSKALNPAVDHYDFELARLLEP